VAGVASSLAESASLVTLEELVGQWVDLRSQIATEKQSWKQQEDQWRREIALLHEEERRLDEQLERAAQFEAVKESRSSDQNARKAEIHDVFSRIEQMVDRAAADFCGLLPAIPPPLKSPDMARACRELTDASRSDSLARRVQLLVGVLSELEGLQNQNHVVRELLELEPGHRREMDIVYLGLARGFAVSPDDSVALQGIPAESGWRWEALPSSHAADVRAMVRILNEEQPPALVAIPVKGSFSEPQP